MFSLHISPAFCGFPQEPQALGCAGFYCSDVYSRVYFVMLIHPSSTYCLSMPAESALASLVSTTAYDASQRMLMKYAGLPGQL